METKPAMEESKPAASVQEDKAARRRKLFGDCALIEIIHLHDCLRGALQSLQEDVAALTKQIMQDNDSTTNKTDNDDRSAYSHSQQKTDIVSWGELDSRTDAIAAGLLAKGLKPGDVAGQMLRNNPDYVLAYFGCIKAGVVPVNVNYHYKPRELADIFTRFGLKALFTESDFAEVGRGAIGDGALTIDVGADDWASLQSTALPDDFAVHADPQSLFLTATGGTTGMPKAVMWPME